jgi:hypothetical protein
MSFTSSPPPSSPSPPPASVPTPTPTPTPSPDEIGLGSDDASTTALVDERIDSAAVSDDESVAGGVLATALMNGLAEVDGAAQGGWISAPQNVDPFTGGGESDGSLPAFAGQDVDAFTAKPDVSNPNAFTGGQDIDPFSGLQNALFFGPGPDGSGFRQASAPADTDDAGGSGQNAPANAAQSQQGTIVGYLSDAYYTIREFILGGVTNVDFTLTVLQQHTGPDVQPRAAPSETPLTPPESPPATPPLQTPSLQPPPLPTPPPPALPSLSAPPASIPSSPPSAPPPADSGGWFIGDLLATIAGLFRPSYVAPYLRPQIPANLPPGMQQLAQMNANMAQQALQDASARTRAGVVGAGLPYVAAEVGLAMAPSIVNAAQGGARAAQTAGRVVDSATRAAAARYPGVTLFAMDVANGLTGTAVPRLALGAGAIAAGRKVIGGIESAGGLPPLPPSAVEDIGSALPALPNFNPGTLLEDVNPALADEVAQAVGTELKSGLPPVPPEVSELPVLRISASRYPELADNIRNAQLAGFPQILTRGGNPVMNRSDALRGIPGILSRDEYPFASTLEGGANTWIGHIPAWQNSAQGGILSVFYRLNNIIVGTQFRVVVVP